MDASTLGDDFRSYLSSLEQEIRGRELKSREEDMRAGGGTAARATVFAARVFAEAEDGSSGRTSASQRSTDTSPLNHEIGSDKVTTLPAQAYGDGKFEFGSVSVESSSDEQGPFSSLARAGIDDSSDDHSLESTPQKPSDFGKGRSALASSMPDGIPPGYQQTCSEDLTNTVDLDSSGSGSGSDGSPYSPVRNSVHDQQAISPGGDESAGMFNFDEYGSDREAASDEPKTSGFVDRMCLEEASTRASLLRHLRHLNERAAGLAESPSSGYTPPEAIHANLVRQQDKERMAKTNGRSSGVLSASSISTDHEPQMEPLRRDEGGQPVRVQPHLNHESSRHTSNSVGAHRFERCDAYTSGRDDGARGGGASDVNDDDSRVSYMRSKSWTDAYMPSDSRPPLSARGHSAAGAAGAAGAPSPAQHSAERSQSSYPSFLEGLPGFGKERASSGERRQPFQQVHDPSNIRVGEGSAAPEHARSSVYEYRCKELHKRLLSVEAEAATYADSLAEVHQVLKATVDEALDYRRKEKMLKDQVDRLQMENRRAATNRASLEALFQQKLDQSRNERDMLALQLGAAYEEIAMRDAALADSAAYMQALKRRNAELQLQLRALLAERCQDSQRERERAEESEESGVFGFQHIRKKIEEAVAEANACDEAERKQKMKDLRLRWHPDKNPVLQEFATEVTKIINEAIAKAGN